MPPSLAFLACLLFVLVLLRLESKESAGVTHFLWIPTIWFLIVCSRPLGLWLGMGGSTIEDGSPMDRIFLIAMFVIALAVLYRRQFVWSVAFREYKWLMFCLGFMLLSTVWSEIPLISFKRWFRSAIAVIICLSVLTEPRPLVAVESILRRVTYICVPFSYVLIHYFPEYGRIYVHNEGVEMWTGVAIHKNSLAQLCLVAFLLIIWRISTREQNSVRSKHERTVLYFDIAVLLIGLVVFMGPNRSITYSATTFLSVLVGCGALGFLKLHRKKRSIPAFWVFLAVSLFLIVYGTITPFIGKLSLFDVSSAMGRTSTLTGRTEVWAALVSAVMKQPFLGAGVGGFWTTEARELYDISGAHNGYLGVILETGFVGWIFCVLFLLSIVTVVYRCLFVNYKWGVLCIIVLLSILTHNTGEESINSFTSNLTAVLLLLYVSCARITTDGDHCDHDECVGSLSLAVDERGEPLT